MYLDLHLNKVRDWRRETSFATKKYFYIPFQGGISFVDHSCYFYVLCLSYFRICSLLPCGHMLGKGRPLGSLIVFLSLYHVVSWVRSGT